MSTAVFTSALVMAALACAGAVVISSGNNPPVHIRTTDNGTFYLPLRSPDPRVTRVAHNMAPEQIKITYWGPGQMLISWATGYHNVGKVNTVQPPLVDSVGHVVVYGTTKGSLTSSATGLGASHKLTYLNTKEGEFDYASPVHSHVLLTGLAAGTTYFYRVGDPVIIGGLSRELNFTMPKAPTLASLPFTLAITADTGVNVATAGNVRGIIAAKPDMVLHVGDHVYGDIWLPNGTINPVLTGGNTTLTYPGGVPDMELWNNYGRMWSPLTENVPFQPAIGNHDLWRQGSGHKFHPFNHRYPTPQTGRLEDVLDSGRDNNTVNGYYSFPIPGAMVFVLSQFHDYDTSSAQFRWFNSSLAKLDRSTFPWLIVAYHMPLYTTLTGHYHETECFRSIYEPLFIRYGVSIVFNGHDHNYQRTYPMNNYKRDSCGPVHLVLGNGGVERVADNRNIDRIPVNSTARPAYCNPNITAASAAMSARLVTYNSSLFQGTTPTVCLSQQATGGNGFCWGEKQPEWQAFRDSSTGHGLLTIVNATHMRFEQKRTDDNIILDATNTITTGTFKPDGEADQFWITRDPACKLVGARRRLAERPDTSEPAAAVAPARQGYSRRGWLSKEGLTALELASLPLPEGM